MDITREQIEELDDHSLGQLYYWELDFDPEEERESTRLIVAEVKRRELTYAEMGEPFEDMKIVDSFELQPQIPVLQ